MIDRSTKAIIRETEFIRAWIAGSHREEYPSLDGWSIVDCDLSYPVKHTLIFSGVIGLTLVRCECFNADFPAGAIAAQYECTNFLTYSQAPPNARIAIPPGHYPDGWHIWVYVSTPTETDKWKYFRRFDQPNPPTQAQLDAALVFYAERAARDEVDSELQANLEEILA